MSTYEEFMVIIAIAGLIVAILNLKNKSAALLSGKEWTAYLAEYFRRDG